MAGLFFALNWILWRAINSCEPWLTALNLKHLNRKLKLMNRERQGATQLAQDWIESGKLQLSFIILIDERDGISSHTYHLSCRDQCKTNIGISVIPRIMRIVVEIDGKCVLFIWLSLFVCLPWPDQITSTSLHCVNCSLFVAYRGK